MINEITQGIVNKLAESFPAATLYIEKVPQNFVNNSFRVKRLAVTSTPGLDTRKWRSITYDILFFPQSETAPETEWNTVAETLFAEIEWITVEQDTMRGEDMSADFDTEEEVGHFRVTFGAFLLDEHLKGDLMEDLYQNEEEVPCE